MMQEKDNAPVSFDNKKIDEVDGWRASPPIVIKEVNLGVFGGEHIRSDVVPAALL